MENTDTYKVKGVTYWRKPLPVVGKGKLRDYMGEALREVRKSQKLEMRDIPGVSIGHISEVERGIKECSSEVFESMCDGVNVKMSQILRITADKLEKVGK